MKKIRYLKNKKGFTLVEIIIVLVILAILAALIIPSLTGYIERGKQASAISEAKGILTAAQTSLSEYYATSHGDIVTRISRIGQKLNGEPVGRITNFMLYTMQQVYADDETIAETYGYDAVMALQVLKYLDSHNSNGNQQYYFRDNKRMDNQNPPTPAQFKRASKSDLGVTILYSASGKIVFLQMIKGDYLVTIYQDKVKCELNGTALKCGDSGNVIYNG